MDIIANELIKHFEKGHPINSFNDAKKQEEISREVSDFRLILHNYIRLNIIDMCSFIDEYNSFFKETITVEERISQRIKKVKDKNKVIKKRIDWQKLKTIRNISMAHNLRDRKSRNELSLDNLKLLTNELSSLEVGIKYSEVVIFMFENIKNEFSHELLEAEKSLQVLRTCDDL
ncbi:MAG: hypothetical protein COW03_11140 [Cytophagales bacterium CG12_big_fil_rev_8_21_14_0_65_40_12]|nr:MAG: hypothetical protein COW03_11140 [Cytophagales bacterium CG12_big_fil_rev_8_21_14_0_65_40_12]PIW03504.1 MAG: hypothetical protein COW40_14355 [Cytophagales bacterium CG17_big_fil_post_rev_8_21_14_2_50_40_13]